jgi:5-methylcytosine-specific restriction enzyme A
MKRIRLSTLQRFDLLQSEKYRCHLCSGLIYVGQAWDVSHEIPLELGGADDEANRRAAHRKCHRDHTAAVDLPAIARAKRVQAAHHGARVACQPMRGGRGDLLKRKMNGTVVFRDSGRPVILGRRMI